MQLIEGTMVDKMELSHFEETQSKWTGKERKHERWPIQLDKKSLQR